MKSMLHEAATVAKAIEKAWTDSGKPSEFTIKIHEMGEKNFLGFNKRPAIVSIIYDPRSQVTPSGEKRVVQPPMRQERPQQGMRERSDQRRRPLYEKRPQMVTRPLQEAINPQAEAWTSDLVTDVEQWFKEIIGLLEIHMPYTTRVDRRALYFIFERGIFSSPDEDRQLFAGLSHLLVQFLKKKHKKKLRGYHLVISTKDYAAPGTPPSASH
jgi:predicted RNA-binding protein Jag